ncbi:hypothetical protein GUJ93_ZPchr0012g20006 [Zizania palustris]|uniref:Uncharacterized protein n=1 Tax=Zizania palustris TaxID=103762 RepID=A0A8J6BT05_ZIZPA|nr:hypothetical protein GUJ93_ZPchr0012g20006 [Zizania palustris]
MGAGLNEGSLRNFNVDDLALQSWRPASGAWVWISRGAPLSSRVLALGFPATLEEIRRLGATARKVCFSSPRLVDSRSFAEVVTSSQMDSKGFDAKTVGADVKQLSRSPKLKTDDA